MATVTVRQATPDNAAELARLLDLFDTVGATPEQVAARMLACQNVLWIFLGDLDGQPVGFACLRLIPHLQGDDPYAELTDIYVDAPFRRQDVACGLIAHVEAAARAAGARAVLRRLRRRLRVPVLPQPRRLDAPSGEQGPPNIPLRADRSDPPNLARPQHRRADGGAVDAACWRVVVWSRRALSTGDTDAGSQGRIYRVDQSKGEQRWCRPLSADATTRRPLAARRPRCRSTAERVCLKCGDAGTW